MSFCIYEQRLYWSKSSHGKNLQGESRIIKDRIVIKCMYINQYSVAYIYYAIWAESIYAVLFSPADD